MKLPPHKHVNFKQFTKIAPLEFKCFHSITLDVVFCNFRTVLIWILQKNLSNYRVVKLLSLTECFSACKWKNPNHIYFRLVIISLSIFYMRESLGGRSGPPPPLPRKINITVKLPKICLLVPRIFHWFKVKLLDCMM